MSPGQEIDPRFHIIAIDYGIKRNSLRMLAGLGCRVTVMPGRVGSQEILQYKPDGVFLSNGPGDPASMDYAITMIRELLQAEIPIFGVCLGHQLLALALGGKTYKMKQGHHGANHPVKCLGSNHVLITSMNHGFAVDKNSLPENVEETHISLFDGTNCGIRVKDKPVFSVQYHPEACPGPTDSRYLFNRFIEMIEELTDLKDT